MTTKQKEIILAAAEKYRIGRETPEWNKDEAVQEVFQAMRQAGIFPYSATAGTFFGSSEEGRFYMSIDRGYGTFFGFYKNLGEYLVAYLNKKIKV